MSNDRYRLIDFGGGRKLESLAGYLVDRPSPAADTYDRRSPARWAKADSFFDVDRKSWRHTKPWPGDLSLDCGPFRMPVRPTPFGHIGLFPEQEANWDWLSSNPGIEVAETSESEPTEAEGLNLFGYTGASTMAMLAAGMSVVHVDAAKPNVQAAQAAAQLNEWGDRRVRYIVDDAAKFAAREGRRKRRYHSIVLDPPSYGHGPQGKSWRLQRDLWPLLESCLALLCRDRFRLLITGHSPVVDQREVCNFLKQNRFMKQYGDCSGLRTESGRSQLKDGFGRALDAGFYVRVSYVA